MNRTFFFLQNDTKINDFDEGVLILKPFFWGNVIFKICSFCIKSHVWGREEFLWVAPPDCNAAKLRNECFSLLFMLALLYKARADNIYPGKPYNGKWHCLRKTAQNQNTFIKINDLWCHLAGKRSLYAIMHTTFSFCPSFSWNYWLYVLHSFWATLYYIQLSR